jgi:hypothetical protein
MGYRISQVREGKGNASLDILDEHGGAVVRLDYPDLYEALRARAMLEDATSRAILIKSMQR